MKRFAFAAFAAASAWLGLRVGGLGRWRSRTPVSIQGPVAVRCKPATSRPRRNGTRFSPENRTIPCPRARRRPTSASPRLRRRTTFPTFPVPSRRSETSGFLSSPSTPMARRAIIRPGATASPTGRRRSRPRRRPSAPPIAIRAPAAPGRSTSGFSSSTAGPRRPSPRPRRRPSSRRGQVRRSR